MVILVKPKSDHLTNSVAQNPLMASHCTQKPKISQRPVSPTSQHVHTPSSPLPPLLLPPSLSVSCTLSHYPQCLPSMPAPSTGATMFLYVPQRHHSHSCLEDFALAAPSAGTPSHGCTACSLRISAQPLNPFPHLLIHSLGSFHHQQCIYLLVHLPTLECKFSQGRNPFVCLPMYLPH